MIEWIISLILYDCVSPCRERWCCTRCTPYSLEHSSSNYQLVYRFTTWRSRAQNRCGRADRQRLGSVALPCSKSLRPRRSVTFRLCGAIGSAPDSRSGGCVFESRRGQLLFFGLAWSSRPLRGACGSIARANKRGQGDGNSTNAPKEALLLI